MTKPEINCGNCVGACCINSIVILSSEEALFLDRNNTELVPILAAFDAESLDIADDEELPTWGSPDHIREFEKRAAEATTEQMRQYWQGIIVDAKNMEPGDGLYGLIGRCGLLQEDNSCGSYDDRPRVCSRFEAGTDDCITFRQREGVPTPVELTPKPLPDWRGTSR